MMTAALAASLLISSGSVPEQDRWKVLFDGRSTDAWQGYHRDSFPAGCWAVEDGVLKTVAGAGNRCDIITRDKYRDFELELEYRVGPRGNSGILYRVAELPPPEPTWHSGPEMQILDDERYPDARPETLSGALYDLIAPSNKELRPAGEWNRARVLVRGNHVEHWLNGNKLLEYELGSSALQALIAKSKFKDLPRFAREEEGYIALQHHGEEAWFRNIRIRPISTPTPRR